MRDLLRFIIRNHFFILFLLLQGLSLFFVINYNDFQRAKIYSAGNNLTGGLYQKMTNMNRYFNLREINRDLLRENALLRNQLKSSYRIAEAENLFTKEDTIFNKKFEYIPAQVINNSVNKPYNFITLNKGATDSIVPEAAVISNQGVVGIVKNVSAHHSTVISLLNKNLKLSAKIKKNNYFGVLEWEGNDYRYVYLHDIPHHVRFETGDTIVTSGFSAIFPEGIPVGTIADYQLKGGNFYSIKVALNVDFKSLNDVYAIRNLMQDEIKSLEEEALND